MHLACLQFNFFTFILISHVSNHAGGIDFIYTSIDRTFPAGSVPILNTSCVMIQTIGDMIVGATKTFTVSLSTNNSQVTIGDRGIGASVVVSIYNIDGMFMIRHAKAPFNLHVYYARVFLNDAMILMK